MEDASGVGLTQFKRWVQPGRTRAWRSASYDAAANTYRLQLRQAARPRRAGREAALRHPAGTGLLDIQGRELPLQLVGEDKPVGTSRVLQVTQAEQAFTFVNIAEQPFAFAAARLPVAPVS